MRQQVNPNAQMDDFREIWLAHFAYDRPPGERPAPTGLVCRELRSGRELRLGREELAGGPSPFPTGHDVLFVAYDSPAALGCLLSMGWALPENVLDLHAEFRRLNSGLLPPGDYA